MRQGTRVGDSGAWVVVREGGPHGQSQEMITEGGIVEEMERCMCYRSKEVEQEVKWRKWTYETM